MDGSRSLLPFGSCCVVDADQEFETFADAERVPAAVEAATTTSSIPSGELCRPTATGHHGLHGGRLRPQLEPQGALAHAVPRHAQLKPRRPWARCRAAPPPTSWLGRSAQTALCRAGRRRRIAHPRTNVPLLVGEKPNPRVKQV
jgi:hypothetical protein